MPAGTCCVGEVAHAPVLSNCSIKGIGPVIAIVTVMVHTWRILRTHQTQPWNPEMILNDAIKQGTETESPLW